MSERQILVSDLDQSCSEREREHLDDGSIVSSHRKNNSVYTAGL